MAAIASAGTRTALLCHLEAIERGDDRGRFARYVDQDRGGRAAILGAVIDAGKHDQRADRRQAEGDREQHGDRRNGADARQHADQGADQRTDQAEHQIDRADGDGKAENEIVKQIGQRPLTAR
jgi:hypothetical protein